MSKKKTSFKELLSKGASNPRVNVQNVRDQRQRLDTLKRSAQPAAASAQPPPAKRVASSSDAPALPAPKTSAAAGGQPAFVYAPTFAGLRPGYAFKSGPQGVGSASRALTRTLTLTLTLAAASASPEPKPKPNQVLPRGRRWRRRGRAGRGGVGEARG